MSLALTSPAFEHGARIPRRHSCQEQGVSPPLAWTGAPEGTRSFALVVTDPDAPVGTITHWLLYDLPPALSALPDAIPEGGTPQSLGGGAQGKNTFGKIRFLAICPPTSTPHRYVFTLFALDTVLGVGYGADRETFEELVVGHVLARTELIGTYGKE